MPKNTLKRRKTTSGGPMPKRRKISSTANPTFGPVSTINTAPVAIGNSLRGTRPITTVISDGLRAVGRDFAFAAQATVAAANGWTLVGGMPLTPSVLPSSTLRNYVQMYSKFKINAMNVHYITSSPTSQAGDIMFYHERDRCGPMIDWTNNSFLPYVLSDPHTIIGPQWTNHTLSVIPTDDFNSTDYGENLDLNEDTAGSIFIFSKTSSASSPGYIILDYDITFKELCVNPRAGILPVARGQWWATCFGRTAAAVTNGTTTVQVSVQGNTIAGTAAASPTGITVGDVYKVIFDVTNSTVSGVNAAWTNVLTTNLLAYHTVSTSTGVTVDDGFTCYALWDGTYMNLYATIENAVNDGQKFYFATTATITFNVCVEISLVYAKASSQGQASY